MTPSAEGRQASYPDEIKVSVTWSLRPVRADDPAGWIRWEVTANEGQYGVYGIEPTKELARRRIAAKLEELMYRDLSSEEWARMDARARAKAMESR